VQVIILGKYGKISKELRLIHNSFKVSKISIRENINLDLIKELKSKNKLIIINALGSYKKNKKYVNFDLPKTIIKILVKNQLQFHWIQLSTLLKENIIFNSYSNTKLKFENELINLSYIHKFTYNIIKFPMIIFKNSLNTPVDRIIKLAKKGFFIDLCLKNYSLNYLYIDDLSSSISDIILNSNKVNKTFIFSQNISLVKLKKIVLQKFSKNITIINFKNLHLLFKLLGFLPFFKNVNSFYLNNYIYNNSDTYFKNKFDLNYIINKR
jgi:hypothetical protein